MRYDEWEQSVPETIRGDSLWKVKAYRLALFLTDVGWHDVTKLIKDRRTIRLSNQLYRSLGSISANLAEGYSRGTGKDRARFYEYSLGSARESRDWYYKGRHILGENVTQHRLQLLTEVIRLLLTMVPQQRGRVLREESAPSYQAVPSSAVQDWESPDNLLTNVPLPE
ncbi:MAG: four helix bundle protein [Chloroflexi bacterium]|nr:four helix bundle protein [Chloroflexota bacterium]